MNTADSGQRPILVVGAAGTHGGTGRFVVEQLRARRLPVRALVRSDDERAAALRELGAEVVVGDLHDRRSLVPALRGVASAYFTYPVKPGVVHAAASFAAAARAEALPRLVVMSMVIAHPEHPSPFAREHWLAEEVFRWAGLASTSLRVIALFFENLPLLHDADVRGDGVLRNSFASKLPVPWMAGEDAAKLATTALIHPERFGDPQDAAYVAGGPMLSHADVARALGAHLARAVRHETVATEAWIRRLVALSEGDPRINPLMAEHIAATGEALSKPRGGPPKQLLSYRELTGEAPQSLEDLLNRGRLKFAS